MRTTPYTASYPQWLLYDCITACSISSASTIYESYSFIIINFMYYSSFWASGSSSAQLIWLILNIQRGHITIRPCSILKYESDWLNVNWHPHLHVVTNWGSGWALKDKTLIDMSLFLSINLVSPTAVSFSRFARSLNSRYPDKLGIETTFALFIQTRLKLLFPIINFRLFLP